MILVEITNADPRERKTFRYDGIREVTLAPGESHMVPLAWASLARRQGFAIEGDEPIEVSVEPAEPSPPSAEDVTEDIELTLEPPKSAEVVEEKTKPDGKAPKKRRARKRKVLE